MNKKLIVIVCVVLGIVILGAVLQTKPLVQEVSDTNSQPVQTSTAMPLVVLTPSPTKQSNLSNDNYYTNVDGNTVHSPAYSNTVPAGATAKCGDGTYSFSQHRSGTCSHHNGVAQWLY
jgi:hypothetical protein